MPLKLIYTSAPRLLQAGRSGFGTVAMSRGIPPEVVKAAETFSQFSRQSGMETGRVVYSYRTVRCSDGMRHVLSCIRDAGADYSGRTNHLAQHLIFDEREAASCASSGVTPAGVIVGTEWPDHDGYCGWIEDAALWASSDPEPIGQWWAHFSASPECRFNLCTQAALRGTVFVYGGGLEKQTENETKSVLCLFAESQMECANRGWGVTFTTSVEPNDEFSDFRWIGVPKNSPLLPKLETLEGREWITFETPPVSRALIPSGAKVAAKPAALLHEQSSYEESGALTAEPAPSNSAQRRSPPPIRATNYKSNATKPAFIVGAKWAGISVLALLVLVVAFVYVRSVFAPIEIKFDPQSLKATYNGGGSHEVRPINLPPRGVIRYARQGTQDWMTNPPSNAGSYSLQLEMPGWFGAKLVDLNQIFVIEKQMPEIRFSGDLRFVHDGEKKEVVPTIVPPEAGVDHVVLYRHEQLSGDWTNSAPRHSGLYTVQVATLETKNYFSRTNETKLLIEKAPVKPIPPVGEGATAQTIEPFKPEVVGALDSGGAKGVRVVLLPEKESAQWLSRVTGFDGGEGAVVEYRVFSAGKISSLPKWNLIEGIGLRWTKLSNGLPLGKPNANKGQPLNYQIASEGHATIQILELADMAGELIRKVFGAGSFYLERPSQDSDSLRLGPSSFFGQNLEVLPSGSYFEVTLMTSVVKPPPVFKFHKAASGWEATLPLVEVSEKEEAARVRLQKMQESAKYTPAQNFYNEAKEWLLRNLREGDHELSKKLKALSLDTRRLGEQPQEHEVMRVLVVDLMKLLEPSLPKIEPVVKGGNPDANNNKRVKIHERSVAEMERMLLEYDKTTEILRAATDWIKGREKEIGSKSESSALKALLGSVANGMGGLRITMGTATPADEQLAKAAADLRDLMNEKALLQVLGLRNESDREMKGQLVFVYPSEGEEVRIVLDDKVSSRPPGATNSRQ